MAGHADLSDHAGQAIGIAAGVLERARTAARSGDAGGYRQKCPTARSGSLVLKNGIGRETVQFGYSALPFAQFIGDQRGRGGIARARHGCSVQVYPTVPVLL